MYYFDTLIEISSSCLHASDYLLDYFELYTPLYLYHFCHVSVSMHTAYKIR